MIVAQQVQDAVENKDTHFVVERAAETESVAACDRGRDGDISQIFGGRSRRCRGPSCGDARGARAARLTMLSPGCWFCVRAICWEGQYIGRAIFATVRVIPARDLRVGDKRDGEAAGCKAQAIARGGEEFLQTGNGNTNATLLIEDHAREINPADSAGRNGQRVRRLKRDRCDRDEWRRARRRP